MMTRVMRGSGGAESKNRTGCRFLQRAGPNGVAVVLSPREPALGRCDSNPPRSPPGVARPLRCPIQDEVPSRFLTARPAVDALFFLEIIMHKFFVAVASALPAVVFSWAAYA